MLHVFNFIRLSHAQSLIFSSSCCLVSWLSLLISSSLTEVMLLPGKPPSQRIERASETNSLSFCNSLRNPWTGGTPKIGPVELSVNLCKQETRNSVARGGPVLVVETLHVMPSRMLVLLHFSCSALAYVRLHFSETALEAGFPQSH